MKTMFGEHVDRVVETPNGLLLYDRLVKIVQIIGQYGEENFCMSYSGGKDSNVMHALFDIALPDNRIPRVYCDTGIELNAVRDFVKAKAAEDDRFVIIRPSVPIKKMLETEGYPFKSKYHSRAVYDWKRTDGKSKFAQAYYNGDNTRNEYKCPAGLKYQFECWQGVQISDRCCKKIKEEPLSNYEKEHGYKYKIIGLMADEGGGGSSLNALHFAEKSSKRFNRSLRLRRTGRTGSCKSLT